MSLHRREEPAYPDTLYVDNLIAPDTGNTMPEAPLRAVHDHGHTNENSITAHYGDAEHVLVELAELGVDYNDVVDQLEREGVGKFVDAWTHLLEHLQQSMAATGHHQPPR